MNGHSNDLSHINMINRFSADLDKTIFQQFIQKQGPELH